MNAELLVVLALLLAMWALWLHLRAQRRSGTAALHVTLLERSLIGGSCKIRLHNSGPGTATDIALSVQQPESFAIERGVDRLISSPVFGELESGVSQVLVIDAYPESEQSMSVAWADKAGSHSTESPEYVA